MRAPPARAGRENRTGHWQSTGSAFILGYLGGSEAFDEALAAWACSYADQTEADHAALEQAVQSGRLAAQRGV
ncbi:DUF2252 family protein [Pseudarthrobacter oxydans]|uniref:DUF2252 family protein n=1 Tax=Pseudarthrobacter oxydans TaxID=1671 RepID=UPI0027D76EC3|nr:DUF2252 family protein [Pseudarthrobacter oxydans]